MPPPTPIEGTPLWVCRRVDAKSPEIGGDAWSAYKDRPWLVLSGAEVHQRKLFIAPPMTSAKKRTRMGLCVKADPTREHSFVDAQQVWTFPVERIVSGESPALGPDGVRQTRRFLRRYLEFAVGPREGWLCQGRVVWLRLVPASQHITNLADPALERDTDIESWRTTVERLVRTKPDRPADWSVPAIVITNDAYLPRTPSPGDRRSDVYALVSVVPLVVAPPQLLTRGAPRVEGSDGVIYAPLTQCLLTLAYDAPAADGGPGLTVAPPTGNAGMPGCISDSVRHQILEEVHELLDLPREPAQHGTHRYGKH